MSEQDPPLEEYVPENLAVPAHPMPKVLNDSFIRAVVYLPAGFAVLWLVAYCVSGLKKANAEAQRDAETSSRLEMLIETPATKEARRKRIEAEVKAESQRFQDELDEISRRTRAGESWRDVTEDIRRRKEERRQEQILEELRAIREELQRRK